MPPQDEAKKYVPLPDGSYGEFPGGMSEEDIQREIDREYPPEARAKEMEKGASGLGEKWGTATRKWLGEKGGQAYNWLTEKKQPGQPEKVPSVGEQADRAVGGISRGLGRASDWLAGKEKQYETEEQARRARGEEPGLLRRGLSAARTYELGSLSDLAKVGAGLTSPRAMAEMGGAALIPQVGVPAFVAAGGKGMYDAWRKGQKEGWTPENVQNLLLAGGQTALAGAGLARQVRAALPAGTPVPETAQPRPVETRPQARIAPAGGGAGGAQARPTPRGPSGPVAPEFERAAQDIFGKPYEQLDPQQMVAVAKRAVPAPTERPRVQPPMEPIPSATQPAAPTARNIGWAPKGGISAAGTEAATKAGTPEQRRMSLQAETDDLQQRLRATSNPQEQAVLQERIRQNQEMTGGGGVPAAPPTQQITPVQGAGTPQFTREKAMGVDWAVGPGGKYRVTVTPGMSDADINAKLQEQQTIHEQIPRAKTPPPQPGTPERPPPEEPDALKREFPDPAVRKFVRANGAEIVRRFGPEGAGAVQPLTNVDIRQAAINAGIDVGTKHVGTKIGLGPEQVSRQQLIDDMVGRGLSPEDIVDFAKPIRKPGTAPRQPRSPFGEPETKGIRGGKGLVAQGMRAPQPLGITDVPAELLNKLEPDEIEFLKGRKALQRNFVKAYDELQPTRAEVKNVIRAGYGLGGWWQRFIDAFEAMGETTDAQTIKKLGIDHAEMLKQFHSGLSGNKAVEVANKMAWGAYRDWLEAGRPTDLRSITKIIRDNGGMTRGPGGTLGLDVDKIFKLVNSPGAKAGGKFTGEAFVRSPLAGKSPGAMKIPSMGATVAGKGNLKRVVFDTHMKDLYNLNDLTDAQYLAASVQIREVGAELEMSGGEAQEQMWGTVLGLKYLMRRGKLTPGEAASRYGRAALEAVGKDYAQVIQDGIANDPEIREIMDDLKKFGFDPGGPVASMRLREIVEAGAKRMAERRPPVSRSWLAKSAKRILKSKSGGP